MTPRASNHLRGAVTGISHALRCFGPAVKGRRLVHWKPWAAAQHAWTHTPSGKTRLFRAHGVGKCGVTPSTELQQLERDVHTCLLIVSDPMVNTNDHAELPSHLGLAVHRIAAQSMPLVNGRNRGCVGAAHQGVGESPGEAVQRPQAQRLARAERRWSEGTCGLRGAGHGL